MDRQRCLALAFDPFARDGEVRLNVTADGRSFRAWLHFVEYPPQWGAQTSPQSMQHPIELRLVEGP